MHTLNDSTLHIEELDLENVPGFCVHINKLKASTCPVWTVDPRDISTSASAWSFWLQTVCGPAYTCHYHRSCDSSLTTHVTQRVREREKWLSVRLLSTSIHEEAAHFSYWVRKSDIFTVKTCRQETRSDVKDHCAVHTTRLVGWSPETVPETSLSGTGENTELNHVLIRRSEPLWFLWPLPLRSCFGSLLLVLFPATMYILLNQLCWPRGNSDPSAWQ